MSTNPTNVNTSSYKTLGSIRNGVKIWKFQNKMSAIDVTHILNSYREKIKGDNKELIYAGRLCFSVTSGGNHGKAYLDKKEAKMIFEMIQNSTFSKHYPPPENSTNKNLIAVYKNYGGSVKEGKVLANVFTINVFTQEKEDYRTKEKKKVTKVEVNIQELPGQKTDTGGYKAIGKAIKDVKTILEPKDLLSMAIECTDFIRAAESKAMAEGIPLNTLTNYEWEKLPQTAGNSSTQSNAQPTRTVEKTNFTPEDLQKMEGKDFHTYYLRKIEEAKLAQEEYNRRIALKKQREAAATS